MKRVLVTGATGFVGRHLCRFLSHPKYRILGTYHHTQAASRPLLRLVRLDLTSQSAVEKQIADFKPDFVYHLAAQSISNFSMDIEEETLMTNTGGTVYLLSALRRYVPRAKFLLASSSHSYGKTFEQKAIVTERDLLWPENPYAVSKVLAELACRDFATRFGLYTVVARSFNHIGTGQRRDLVFSDWCRQVALAEAGKGPRVLQVGNLEVERDFLHVEDVVRAYALLMEKAKPGSVYNICSRKLYKLTLYLDFLLRKAKIFMVVEKDPAKVRRHESRKIAGDPSRMEKLGWRPQRNALDAMEELLAEWRQKVRAF